MDDPLRTGGHLEGRKLFWKRIQHDYGPSAEINGNVASHLEYLKGDRLEARLRAEDARIGSPILEATSEGRTVYFEDGGNGTLRFYADDEFIGTSACADVYRLTARHSEGVWRIYEV